MWHNLYNCKIETVCVAGRCVKVILSRAALATKWGLSLASRPAGGLAVTAVSLTLTCSYFSNFA